MRPMLCMHDDTCASGAFRQASARILDIVVEKLHQQAGMVDETFTAIFLWHDIAGSQWIGP